MNIEQIQLMYSILIINISSHINNYQPEPHKYLILS